MAMVTATVTTGTTAGTTTELIPPAPEAGHQ